MRRGPFVLALGIALALACAPSALAAIKVNTTKDETIAGNGTCSLREAIRTASGDPSSDCPGVAVLGTTTIDVPAAHYHLTQGAQLGPNGNLAIVGTGSDPSQTIIDGDHHSRVVLAEGTLTISNLTITGGQAPAGTSGSNGGAGQAGQNGGGIFNDGASLSLNGVVLSGNAAGDGGRGGDQLGGCTAAGHGGNGGNGGGIYSDAPLSLTRVTITANRGGDGGAGGKGLDVSGAGTGCPGGLGGNGGLGGGLASESAAVTVFDSTVSENSSGNGGAGGLGGAGTSGGSAGAGGNGGSGGGIEAGPSFALTDSTVAGNVAGSGGTGGSGGSRSPSTGTGGSGGRGGAGGSGGGVFGEDTSSSDTVTSATLSGNLAGDGGYGGAGGPGSGSGRSGGAGGDGGAGGTGGGLFQDENSAGLEAATISSNLAGDAGGPGSGGPGVNSAAGGGSGSAGASGAHGGIGVNPAGPAPSAASVSEQDTIVASNLPDNCDSAVSSSGHNLSFPDSTCPHEVSGDPMLGPLQDNGGPTQTQGLQPGSAAINKVPARGAGCPSTDQRGVVRPQPSGGLCDLGAYEVAPPVCRALSASTPSRRSLRIQLSCGDPARLALKYAIVKRPSHGSLTSLDSARGQVTYTPRAGFTGHDSFSYRATNSNGSATARSVAITVTPVPPVLSKVKLAKHRFSAEVGSPLHFTLSAAAQLTVTITHKNGNKAGTRVFAHQRAGADTVQLTGVLAGRTLPPGSYTAKLVANNAGGRSGASTVSFTITP